MAAGGASWEQDDGHGENGEGHDTTMYGGPAASDTPGDKAPLRATTRRGGQWCYRCAGDGRDGRDGIDDTEKESEHGNALQNPLAWSLGRGFIFI